jgi:hypothetical protein
LIFSILMDLLLKYSLLQRFAVMFSVDNYLVSAR